MGVHMGIVERKFRHVNYEPNSSYGLKDMSSEKNVKINVDAYSNAYANANTLVEQ